ncbi:MAG: hypothetical protein WBC07_12870 [Methylotenera sp.]
MLGFINSAQPTVLYGAGDDRLFGGANNHCFDLNKSQQNRRIHNAKNAPRENHASGSRMDIGLQGRCNDMRLKSSSNQTKSPSNASNNDWRLARVGRNSLRIAPYEKYFLRRITLH